MSEPRIRSRGLLLFAVALAQLCVTLDYLAMSVALPVMSKELHVSTTELQWALSAYLLAFASLMIVGGRVGDIFGRRRGLVAGLIVFGVGSFLGGIAPNVPLLIAARVMMGAGAAFFFPTSFSILTNALPQQERARATGVVVGIAALGLAIGPFVGGLLTDTLGWRWVFFFNVPVAMIALTLALLVMTDTRDESVPRKIDWPGLFTVTVGVVALALVIDYGRDWGWASPTTFGALGLSIVMLIAFARIEGRAANPLLDLKLLRIGSFSAIAAIGSAANFLFPLSVLALTLYLQDARHFSPLASGAGLLPFSIAGALAGPVAGRLDAKYGPRPPMAGGLALSTLALAFIGFSAANEWSIALQAPLYFALGFGMGGAYATTNAASLSVVPAQQAGAASGIVLTGLALSAAFAVTVTSELIEGFQGRNALPDSYAISMTLLVGTVISGVATVAAIVFLHAKTTANE